MDKKAVGLSIVSLTAAATLLGASPAKAEGECLKCEPGGPPGIFHKFEALRSVFYKFEGSDPFYKENVFLKLDTAFLKISSAFDKMDVIEPPIVIGLD